MEATQLFLSINKPGLDNEEDANSFKNYSFYP